MSAPLQDITEARQRLYALAARLTYDRELREDLVGEMTIFLLERWKKLSCKPEPYIFRACYRHAIDVLRRGKSIDGKYRHGVFVESLCVLCERLGLDECTFACSLNGKDDPQSILNARCLMRDLLNELTLTQREVLLLLLEGYRPSEIASIRNVSKPTVTKSIKIIQRTITKLRQQ